LKAIIATNSLELGIDIGKLDSVVLIETPRSISSAIQRIGRSGHGVGEISSGLLFPTHGMDFVSAAVIARAIADGEIEELHPVEAPLDLLVQIVLAMSLAEEWRLDELYAFLKTSFPYRNLTRQQFDLVVGMLEGKYADSHVYELKPRATVDRLEGTITSRPGLSSLVYLEGGTIPERGYFELRLKDSAAKIGELDEEFVWERKLGDTFALGSQVWQITEISHSTVEVLPAHKPQQIIPFWRAEELDRDFFYSERIGLFLEFCNRHLDDEDFLPRTAERYFMERGAAESLQSYLKRQKDWTKGDLPHRHHLLVELYHDPLTAGQAQQIILHTLWGNAINRPFTFALSAAWEKRYGYALQTFYNNDGIALLVPHELEDLRQLLALVTPENIESLLRESLESTGYFGARFRENAGRALLLSRTSYKRRMPLWLNRLRSRKLLSSVLRYRDFPILLETWRSSLQDDFDLVNLKRLLEELREGEIEVSEIRTSTASPFAQGLIWLQTNKYVYEDDTPEGARKSALGQDLLKELVFASHLRPRLPLELIRLFEAKQQRTAPGYAPDSPRELIDWVKERLLVPEDEWSPLLEAMERDAGLDSTMLSDQVAERLVALNLPGAGAPLLAAVEMLPEIAHGLALRRQELNWAPLRDDARLREELKRSVQKIWQSTQSGQAEVTVDEEDATAPFLGKWLSYYGPIDIGKVRQTLGVSSALLDEALRSLEETGLLVLDQFTELATEPQVCDAGNLESLLRMLRRARKPAFEALGLEHLPLFLARHQGLVKSGDSIDALKDRLEQLLGVPLNAGVWEEEVLPARLQPYFGSWLDSLLHTSDLLWFGCGQRKVSFAFPEDLDLFLEREADVEPAEVKRLLPDVQGSYSLPAICAVSGLPAASVIADLWKLAWRGMVSNDSYLSVRKGILNKFVLHAREIEHGRGLRGQPFNRWNRSQEGHGNWYLLPVEPPSPDVLEQEERNKERVRIVLERYGILFKELLLRELPLLQWGRLFRTLRLMEMSGEVLSGNFFNGIPGLQFISQDGYRELTQGLKDDGIYWLNATDPASLCGSGLEGLRQRLPARLPSTHLVYRGVQVVVVSRRFGKELEITVQPDDPRLPEYLAFFKVLLSREFNPLKRVAIERINDVAAASSAYKAALKDFGFEESYQGLELWRRY
jgi:ATP-dependent Lhr-like helicase